MRIKVEKGSKEEMLLENSGIIIERKDNMQNTMRKVYVIYPIEGLKLIGCLSFDYYDEVISENEESKDKLMLFSDVHLFDISLVPNSGNTKQHQLGCLFIRYGQYLMSSEDVIIELDIKSPIYQQYMQFISGLTLVTSLPTDLTH